jgi:hypothetical protein
MRNLSIAIIVLVTLTVLLRAQIAGRPQGYIPFAGEPINYRSNDLNDPVAKLQKRQDKGEVALQYEPKNGYLRSVPQPLNVPVSSQTLVFSKTRFQYGKISPETPRALFFNDDVYVGRVQPDYAQGHIAPSTRNVPGVFLRLVSTNPEGTLVAKTPQYITGQQSPIGEQPHLGKPPDGLYAGHR